MRGHRQGGMTFWGLIVVAFLVVFFAVLIIKLMPPYITHAKAAFALRAAVKQSGGASSASAEEVRKALERRFDIDEIRDVDLKTALRFERPRSGIISARLEYEVRIPIFYNVSAVIEFDDSVELRPN